MSRQAVANVMSPKKLQNDDREASAIAVRNVLHILMYFKSGKACVLTHDFINQESQTLHGANRTADFQLRWWFYLLIWYLVTNKGWTSDAFLEVLDRVNRLERESRKYSGTTAEQWASIKMDIVFQAGLATLRDAVGLEAEELPVGATGTDLKFPKDLSVDDYKRKVEVIFSEHEEVYDDAASGGKNPLYDTHSFQLNGNIIVDVPVAAGGKRTKSRMHARSVYNLLNDNRLNATINRLIKSLQAMEALVLPVPSNVLLLEESPVKNKPTTIGWADREADTVSRKATSTPWSSAAPASAAIPPAVYPEGSGASERMKRRRAEAEAQAKSSAGPATKAQKSSGTTSSAASSVTPPVADVNSTTKAAAAVPEQSSKSAVKGAPASKAKQTAVSAKPRGKKAATGAASGASLKASSKRAVDCGSHTPWIREEEAALAEAVNIFGEGNWAGILSDLDYSQAFADRTEMELKDKWEKMSK